MLPRPASVVAAVVVTFAVAGVMRLSTRSMSVEHANETSSRLDSARYKREIVALEDALYQNERPSMTDFMTISGALHELGFAIAGRELNPTSRQVAEDVSVLAASADVGESGYALPDITELRNDWELLRAQRFGEADWFREATPELEEAQSDPTPAVDDSFVDDLLRTLVEIEDLAKEGRRTCNELGEPFYDFESAGPEGELHIEKWNLFASTWEDNVTTIASHLPTPPPWDGDPEMTAAYQEATGALSELRNAAMGNGNAPVPTEPEWSARFDEAVRLVEQSRARLSR